MYTKQVSDFSMPQAGASCAAQISRPPNRWNTPAKRYTFGICCLLLLLSCPQPLRVKAGTSPNAPTIYDPASTPSSHVWGSLTSGATSGPVNFTSLYTLELVSNATRAVADGSHSWGIDWDLLDDSSTSQNTSIRGSATAGPLLQQLAECLDATYNSSRIVSYDSIVSGVLPSLKVVAGWWKAEAPRIPVTLATFTSMQRMSQLKAQCQAWPGPISAVLYQPLLQQKSGVLSTENKQMLRHAVLQMLRMIDELSKLGSCHLSLLLVTELIGEEAVIPLLPLNSLRNLARLQVQTPLVALVDVDLLPSRTLYQRFANETQARLIEEKVTQQEVFIMPAFTLSNQYASLAWADTLVTAPDAGLMKHMLMQKAVGQVAPHYKRGHRLIDYVKWQGADADYLVPYEEGGEPYVLGAPDQLPWFDERYRGHGLDKIQCLHSMQRQNYTVLHDVYLIHRPHQRNLVMMNHTSHSIQKRAPLLTHLKGMYSKQKQALQRGDAWQAPVSKQLQTCLAKCGWWAHRRKAAALVSMHVIVKQQPARTADVSGEQ